MTDATTPGQPDSATAQAIPLREEVSGDAARLAQTAKDRIDQAADGQKQAAVGVAKSATSAIDRAVNALREDDQAPDWLAQGFETAARQIESFAGSIEGKNIDDLRRNVTQFARQNPMTFLAVSAAAGFAAARFLRAGSEYKTHQSEAAPTTGNTSQFDTQQFSGNPSTTSGLASAETPIYGSTTPEFTS
jgi:hypothetical protein